MKDCIIHFKLLQPLLHKKKDNKLKENDVNNDDVFTIERMVSGNKLENKIKMNQRSMTKLLDFIDEDKDLLLRF